MNKKVEEIEGYDVPQEQDNPLLQGANLQLSQLEQELADIESLAIDSIYERFNKYKDLQTFYKWGLDYKTFYNAVQIYEFLGQQINKSGPLNVSDELAQVAIDELKESEGQNFEQIFSRYIN
jgi:hypothetical protein